MSYAKGTALATGISGIFYIKETLGLDSIYRINKQQAF